MKLYILLLACFSFLLTLGCEDGVEGRPDGGLGAFEESETIERLSKEMEILKWENSRLALKMPRVDGSELVRDKVTGLWHHDVERVPYTGRAFETYPSGNPKGEASFLKGLQDGMSRFWHENGARKEESQWFDGRRHGLFRRWDDLGKLVEAKRYKNGELIEVILKPRRL